MLAINVSNAVYSHLSVVNQHRLDDQLKKLRPIARSVKGKSYNISLSDAYMIIYQKNVPNTNMSAEEILSQIDLFLNGPPPTWIKEHPEFKGRLFKKVIMPKAVTFTAYLYRVSNALQYLASDKYYDSFQAVYYGYWSGYTAI